MYELWVVLWHWELSILLVRTALTSTWTIGGPDLTFVLDVLDATLPYSEKRMDNSQCHSTTHDFAYCFFELFWGRFFVFDLLFFFWPLLLWPVEGKEGVLVTKGRVVVARGSESCVSTVLWFFDGPGWFVLIVLASWILASNTILWALELLLSTDEIRFLFLSTAVELIGMQPLSESSSCIIGSWSLLMRFLTRGIALGFLLAMHSLRRSQSLILLLDKLFVCWKPREVSQVFSVVFFCRLITLVSSSWEIYLSTMVPVSVDVGVPGFHLSWWTSLLVDLIWISSTLGWCFSGDTPVVFGRGGPSRCLSGPSSK